MSGAGRRWSDPALLTTETLQRPLEPAAGPYGRRGDHAALELVRPLPDGLLDVYPLSAQINSSRVEGIELLTPLHG
jgi:hypothetical protein